jgi:multidrug efflux pump subunit AcrA (membrane-fusion protein)
MKSINLKTIIGILVIPVLSFFGYMGYLDYLAPIPAEAEAILESKPVEIEPEIVSAEGKVLPSRYAQLNFKAPGLIEEVLVDRGDQVEEGQVLARLEGHDQLFASVAAAQLELIHAEQSLDELYEHLDLRRAQALQAVLEAQDQVDEAERILTALTTPASEHQVEAAEEAVILAEKNKEVAKERLAGLSKKPEGSPQRAAAELALFAVERQYQAAVAYENALKSNPDEQKIAEAETNLEIAQINLAEAERELEIRENGPDPDELALAEARVENAKAQFVAAEAALEDLDLVAPFAGEIISLNLKVGEVSNPGVPSVLLADRSSWHVETTDLTEVDVSQIAPGMKAIITLNAFPDQKFTGVVKEVDLLGVERRGTVTYSVKLDFDTNETPVRMEMSVFVEILLP